MSTGHLTIDLSAVIANWKALDQISTSETAAVVKANGYGLGSRRVARALARAGARKFFVATAEEAANVRNVLGDEHEIYIFAGHMSGDTDMISDLGLIPLLNSLDQMVMHLEALPNHPFGVQLDTDMNRLGMEPAEWGAVRDMALSQNPKLIMSHLACADEPDHTQNAMQLTSFRSMTDGVSVPRSLAATGGILLGSDYHFDLTRPGVGLYGGAPFANAKPVVQLDIPVIQVRDVAVGEAVGYGASWVAERPSKIATISAGYADGLIRAMSGQATLWHEGIPCPLAGRVSMDLLTVDVTDLPIPPRYLSILCPEQSVDDLAAVAGTIGYEILTSLGGRYSRRFIAP